MSDPAHDFLKLLPPLREVISVHNLRAEKSLGQNFLLDGNITDKIVFLVDERITPEMTLFEIGPGPGGLTRSLLQSKAASIMAIEFDHRAVAALQDLQAAAGNRLTVIHADALKSDITSLSGAPRGIVANLPYNIATPLLIDWLQKIANDPQSISFMALMFQKEVAERIVAAPGNKIYGRLSVITQWLCETRKVYDLPPSAFTPPPKVSSAVVRFIPRLNLQDSPAFSSVERVTAAAFNQRRKMIRASLKDYMDGVVALGLDPTLRAENLSVENFIALARFKERQQK